MVNTGGAGPPSSGVGFYSALANAGQLLSIFGAVNSAIGTYFDIQSQKNEAKSKESSLRYQQQVAGMNASIAREHAMDIAAAGQAEVGRYTLQAGQEKARNTVSQAKSGVQLGSGSAAEVQASSDILAKIDRYNIERNIARSVAAARTQSVDIQNQARLLGVSADNVRGAQRSLNPYIGVSTSLLSSAGTLSNEWRYAQNQRRNG